MTLYGHDVMLHHLTLRYDTCPEEHDNEHMLMLEIMKMIIMMMKRTLTSQVPICIASLAPLVQAELIFFLLLYSYSAQTVQQNNAYYRLEGQDFYCTKFSKKSFHGPFKGPVNRTQPFLKTFRVSSLNRREGSSDHIPRICQHSKPCRCSISRNISSTAFWCLSGALIPLSYITSFTG